jgi:hypothetical protein
VLSWLLDQMARVIDAGFDPNMGYSVVDLLGKIAPEHPDKTVHVLSGLLNSTARKSLDLYGTPTGKVLENGLAAGTPTTVARVRELISFLSTIAETSYSISSGQQLNCRANDETRSRLRHRARSVI